MYPPLEIEDHPEGPDVQGVVVHRSAGDLMP
jgi:hypothetical protein